MSEPRVLIVIPAFNEAESLAAVISDVRQNLAADIVVVDDGSGDGTAAAALAEGVGLLQLPFNLGIGSAMQTGFRYADREGYDIAVQVDGDGQHDAGYLPALIGRVASGECDMAVGSRYLADSKYSGTAGRRLGTAIFSRIVSAMIGQRVSDATSGFRAINRPMIEMFAHDYPRDYPEVEALLLAHLARLRISEIPVKMHPRESGRSSIHRYRSVYYMVKVMLALIVGYSRPRASGPHKVRSG